MTVLHVDDQLFVVNKPPGLLSQPDETGDTDVTALGRRMLDGKTRDESFLGLVHRLDRPASGVMVLARTSSAARALSSQFRERVVDKRYVVLVEGALRGIGRWTDYIAKPGRRPQLVSPDHPEGKRAELQWQALASGVDRTLLQVELQTGRPHQIRMQAATRGHPVLGDVRYGAEAPLENRAIALHQALLRVDHPTHQHRETFVAFPPDEWKEAATEEMESAVRRMLDRAQMS